MRTSAKHGLLCKIVASCQMTSAPCYFTCRARGEQGREAWQLRADRTAYTRDCARSSCGLTRLFVTRARAKQGKRPQMSNKTLRRCSCCRTSWLLGVVGCSLLLLLLLLRPPLLATGVAELLLLLPQRRSRPTFDVAVVASLSLSLLLLMLVIAGAPPSRPCWGAPFAAVFAPLKLCDHLRQYRKTGSARHCVLRKLVLLFLRTRAT